jgi:hypothetical protein
VRLALRAKAGRPKRDEGNVGNTNISKDGTTVAYTLARLDRDRPDLARQVREGRLSANAAAIEAGFRKQLTPIDHLQKWWVRMKVVVTLRHCREAARTPPHAAIITGSGL